MNGTLQDRLGKELRLAGISDMESANRFLLEGQYLRAFNRQFARISASPVDVHRGVLRRLTQWMVVFLLIVSVGGHWAILQSAAWVTMLARFSQRMSLAQAAQYTFDGKHPCAMCKAMKEGKQAERKESQVKPPEKLTFDLSPEPSLLPARPPATPIFAACFPLRSSTNRPTRRRERLEAPQTPIHLTWLPSRLVGFGRLLGDVRPASGVSTSTATNSALPCSSWGLKPGYNFRMTLIWVCSLRFGS